LASRQASPYHFNNVRFHGGWFYVTATFHPNPSTQDVAGISWVWWGGIPVAALIVFGLGWAWFCEPANTPFTPPPPPLSGWQVTFAGASPDSQIAGYEGTYRPGELLFAPPGATVTCKAQPAEATGCFASADSLWTAQGGRLEPDGAILTPRQPGLYRLAWRSGDGKEADRVLHVLVLCRAERSEADHRTTLRVLNQDIGSYGDPRESKIEKIQQYASRYQPPEYFAVLDSETLKLKVGRSLELGQLVAFIDRRGTDGKKIYTTTRHTNVMPPSKALCEKLSLLMDRLQAQGVKVTHFWITSGFRTPTYNRSIGGAAYSRHCYGDAVDLVIDENGDHHMDDLNGDGRVDKLDGSLIARVCQSLEREGAVAVGGIGVYEWDADDSVRSHVHIDCRGYPARWGQIARGRGKLSYDWWSAIEGKDKNLDGGD
jgi:hypothetical protein